MSIFKESDASTVISDNAVIVDSTGYGHFQTLEAAIAYVNSLSHSNSNFIIWVRAGTYTVDNSAGAISVNAWTSIVGDSDAWPVIGFTTNANAGITSTTNGVTSFSNLTFAGPTSNAALVLASTGGAEYVTDCFFTSGSIGVKVTGAGNGSTVRRTTFANLTTAGVSVDAGANFQIFDSLTAGNAIGFRTTAAGAGILVFGCEMAGDTIALNGDGDITSTIAVFGTLIVQATTGLHLANGCIGVVAGGGIIASGTNSIVQATSTCQTFIVGTVIDVDTISIASGGIDNVCLAGCTDFATQNTRIKRVAYSNDANVSKSADLVTISVSAKTLTLPALTNETANFPLKMFFYNESTGNVTIGKTGGDTINGGASFTLPAKTSVLCYGSGTAWFVG